MTSIKEGGLLFFSTNLRDADGNFLAVPDEVMKLRDDLMEGWYKNYPNLTHEAPRVTIYPSNDPENQGWFVSAEISREDPSLP